MPDERSDEKLTALRAQYQTEQLVTAAKAMAQGIYTYYHTLCASGFSQKQALELTVEYQRSLFQRQ